MIEIRWHGRGGQGSFTAARLLGHAAMLENKYAQAFPSFGPERRGAPVLGFTRIDTKQIRNRDEVQNCDCVVVLDETLMAENVVKGIKPGGYIVINTVNPSAYDNLFKDLEVVVVSVDATKLALEYLGLPITNTAMIGALAASMDFIGIDAIREAIRLNMKPKIVEKNLKLFEKAYELTKGECQ